MFTVEKKNKATWVHCTVNGQAETIRFSPYSINSSRSTYNILQEYGLDENGKFGREFCDFETGSTEAALLDFVISGTISDLLDRGLVLCDRPKKGNISRNLGVFDPASGYLYFIGGVGLIKPTDDHTCFELTDPLLGQYYGEYQEARGNPVGGTQYFSEEGMTGSINRSIVGTLEYETGLYHAVRKALENEKLREKGLNCPHFIAAGKILNFENGKFGFTIYRNRLTPEYLLNVGLYLDQQGGFKQNFQVYLQSKYSQLFMLHNEIHESHGQPSITNTLCEIDVSLEENNLSCQIKDFETNQPIPENTTLTIEEGISTIPCGWYCKKSPHAGAQLYDLHHALLQELNVLYLPLQSIQNPQQKFNYIAHQSAQLLLWVSQYYKACDEAKAREAVQFAIDTFIKVLKSTNNFACYNDVISGAFAHKLFSLSDQFSNQVQLHSENN